MFLTCSQIFMRLLPVMAYGCYRIMSDSDSHEKEMQEYYVMQNRHLEESVMNLKQQLQEVIMNSQRMQNSFTLLQPPGSGIVRMSDADLKKMVRRLPGYQKMSEDEKRRAVKFLRDHVVC